MSACHCDLGLSARGVMSAWDDPTAHIRALETEVWRLRLVVARVGGLAGSGEVDEIDEPWVRVRDLRAALGSQP